MTCERIVLQDVLQLCCVLFSCPLVKRSTKLNFWTKITNYITDKWKYRRLHLRSQILSIILGLRSSQLLLRGILPYEIWCIAVLWESTKISEEHIYSIFRIEDSAKKKKTALKRAAGRAEVHGPPQSLTSSVVLLLLCYKLNSTVIVPLPSACYSIGSDSHTHHCFLWGSI